MKDKQIEEMCEVLRKNAESCKTCNWYAEGLCIGNCELAEDNQTVCETLYNAGYRKSTELAEEIFAEIDEELNFVKRAFPLSPITNHIIYVFAELKKKYIGEDTNVTTNTEEGE